MIRITADELKGKNTGLRAGDEVLLSGGIYIARDAAHKRIAQMLDRGEEPPFEIDGAVIYYCGPTGTPPGKTIGSCGPTTAGRMDVYAARLYALGLAATIGKGPRSGEVRAQIARSGALYLCALGGCGALMSLRVKENRPVAFEDLGCEAVRRIIVEDMPLIVGIDPLGNDVFGARERSR